MTLGSEYGVSCRVWARRKIPLTRDNAGGLFGALSLLLRKASVSSSLVLAWDGGWLAFPLCPAILLACHQRNRLLLELNEVPGGVAQSSGPFQVEVAALHAAWGTR